MNKLPRKIKHWANEAIAVHEGALALLHIEDGVPTNESVLEFITHAPRMAAKNRGIKDENKVSQAEVDALNNLSEDISRLDPGEALEHSICFLLAYFDAHIFYGFMSEQKSQDIMHFITEKHDVSFAVT